MDYTTREALERAAFEQFHAAKTDETKRKRLEHYVRNAIRSSDITDRHMSARIVDLILLDWGAQIGHLNDAYERLSAPAYAAAAEPTPDQATQLEATAS